MHYSLAHKPVIVLTLLSLLASVLTALIAAPVAALAQDAPVAPSAPPAISVQISAANGGTAISYDAGAGELTAAGAAQSLPLLHYGGYVLPMQLYVLQESGGGPPQLAVEQVAAVDLAAPPQPAAAETPTALGWEPDPNYAPPVPALPTQPVFIARQGAIHGRQVIVVAVSPIYSENGVARIASHVQATVSGAAPMDAAALASLAASAAASAQTPIQVPVNSAALTNSYKLLVANAGLQEVLYSDLGLASEPADLHLTLAGADIPVEKAGDRFRFYAPQAGDRWNRTTIYWLMLENGPAITQAAAAPAGPTLAAYEQGEWRANQLYEPGYPGADGDHWFHADLKAPAVLPQGEDITQAAAVTVPLTAILPPAGGASTYGVIATGYRLPINGHCETPYQLHVQGLAGGALAETRVTSWQATPNCRLQTTSTAVFSSDAALTSLLLRLKPNNAYATAIKLEAVAWQRPVVLDFQNVPGSAEFYTDGGAGSVTLHNLPAAWRLYDVTQADAPQFVAAGAGGDYTLNQAAAAPAGRYLLANLAAPQRPTVQTHPAAVFGDVKSADAIYIGPAAFADELAPLLQLRREQGYTPVFVDVQAIYDVYGYGQVSAAAIRNFLRQESDWQNMARRIAVVLAGDATMDPFAYGGVANDTLVAPWMAEVDPYLGAAGRDGEAACDACIAQLNGDDPLTGDYPSPKQPWFAADVWLGRLPVRSEQEMADVVTKLVAYDTNTGGSETWRMRKVFLADNYIKAIDAQLNAKPDDAGDFAAFSDSIVGLLPSASSVRRLYYDPAPDRVLTSTPAPGGYYQTVARTLPEGWRISDIAGINAQVIGTLSQGAGLVTYNGHSNHFYYARTEDVRRTGIGDKWLLNAPEVSLLSNKGKEFVMLSMTCYTSQFVKPTANGTLDEWLIRHTNGGAVAVWGPTGLSVVSGHELLQAGFVQQLTSAPGEQRVGGLVEAGYTHLLTNNGPLDPLMTFVLLGDPLTRARIPTHELYLPAVRR